ncbi:MAG: hypothetical protein KAZ30_01865 [Candidatus Magasanikbacteria bacterium]|nr:hypothetical protein [Candidatus Magasanikbacteria bacterium]
MRVFINFTIALFTLFVAACTPDIKVPVPEVKVPLPPELIAAAAAAFAAGNSDEPCPPQEHEPATPVDGVDNDHDGITEAKEVDWFDPFTLHGNMTVFCPDSCTIRMTLSNGFKWTWQNPGSTDRLTEFSFAGELLVPAFDHAEFYIAMGGHIDGDGKGYIDAGEGNLLRFVSQLPNGGGKEYLTFEEYPLSGMQIGHWLSMEIFHIKTVDHTE